MTVKFTRQVAQIVSSSRNEHVDGSFKTSCTNMRFNCQMLLLSPFHNLAVHLNRLSKHSRVGRGNKEKVILYDGDFFVAAKRIEVIFIVLSSFHPRSVCRHHVIMLTEFGEYQNAYLD